MSRSSATADSFWVSHTLCAAYLIEGDESSRLRGVVEKWIEDCEPRLSDKEALDLLFAEKGTPLEPFLVPSRLEPLAVAIIRLVTSIRADCSRVRFVSGSAHQDLGGLVITRRLRTFYADSFAFSQRPRPISTSPYLLLNRVPKDYSAIMPESRAFQSTLSFLKTGVSISIPSPLELLGHGSAGEGISPETVSFIKNSTSFGGTAEGLESMGLRIELDPKAIVILSGNAGSLTRLTSLLAGNATLSFKGPYSDARTIIPLMLPPPDQDTQTLDSIHFPRGFLLPWIRLPIRTSPPLDQSCSDYLKELLSPGFRPLIS
jgi:hypothetical protein